jgi:hypothetical protein
VEEFLDFSRRPDDLSVNLASSLARVVSRVAVDCRVDLHVQLANFSQLSSNIFYFQLCPPFFYKTIISKNIDNQQHHKHSCFCLSPTLCAGSELFSFCTLFADMIPSGIAALFSSLD